MSEKFKVNLKYAFRLHKPILVMRLAWAWLMVTRFGKHPLRYVDTAIGYKCNMSCKHCFAKDKQNPKRGRMPPSYFKGVATQCMKLGAVNFSFQGGEPLIYQDLKAYIKAAKPYKNLISITTNGKILTLEKCRELRKWGVDIITLSVDRHRKQVNWITAIDYIRRSGMNVTIGTTVTHQDIVAFREGKNALLKFLIDKAQAERFILMLIYAVPMGGFAGQDIMLQPDDAKYIKELCRQSPFIRTDFQANWKEEGCGAGKEILFINPYGDVFACPFIDIPFGNVRTHTIKEVMRRISCNKKLKEYYPKCLAGEEKGLWGEF